MTADEVDRYKREVRKISAMANVREIENSILNQDIFDVLDYLPPNCVNLLFIDPPYNLTKSFNGNTFRARSCSDYMSWLESWLPRLLRALKQTASVYICGDWRSSAAVQLVGERHLTLRNRITWEREKGRGALSNWKNCSEDIWFFTVGENYTFHVDAVKLKRRIIAPYTSADGTPKGWADEEGSRYRLTHPSNLWTDVTVPFWSMPENTEHPTQKPEKLLAKIILASSNEGDLILDPFVGSGTSCVVAKKLGRRYLGVDLESHYCCLAKKRLSLAEQDSHIQGYADGVFWERNSLREQKTHAAVNGQTAQSQMLF